MLQSKGYFKRTTLTWQAHLQLRISLQATSTVYNVHQVDGGPGKWHPVPAETLAELLRLAAKLLQLLFVLKSEGEKQTYQTRLGDSINRLRGLSLHFKLECANWAKHKKTIKLFSPRKLQLPYLCSIWLFHHHIGLSTFSNITLLQYLFQLGTQHKPSIITTVLFTVVDIISFIWGEKTTSSTKQTDLNDKEDVLWGVGDGEYCRPCQRGDCCSLHVRSQHCFRLLRVKVEEKVFWNLRETETYL